VALRSFMETDVKGQVGGLQSDEETRLQLAERSGAWKCPGCAKTNETIMKESDEEVNKLEDTEGKVVEKEEVPVELRLAYREDLEARKVEERPKTPKPEPTRTQPLPRTPTQQQPQIIARPAVRRAQQPDAWMDKAIMIIGGLLAFLVLRKIMSYS
jgi:ubiquitin-conjugating enzyme E2 J1